MSAQATENQAAAIELIVDQDPQGQVAANVPVRWKISEEMINQLAEQGVKNPFMLLVLEQNGYELDRIMVSLKAGMTYLQMRRPGTVVIHATIVWEPDGGSAKSVVMKKDDHGGYTMTLLRSFVPGVANVRSQIEALSDKRDFEWGKHSDAELKSIDRQLKKLKQELRRLNDQEEVFGLYDGFTYIERTPQEDRINIEVPKQMFAAEPPRWMSWLGNLYGKFWPRKAVDQCDLRRRALFTLFTLPFFGMFWAVIGIVFGVCWVVAKLAIVLVTGVLLFFGKRNLDYSVIYEPDNVTIKDVWRGSRPSFWIYKKVEVEKEYRNGGKYSETEYQPRNPVFLTVNPPVMVVVFLLTLLVSGGPLWQVVLSTVFLAGSIGGALALLGFVLKRNFGDEKVITDEEKDKVRRDLSLLTSGGAASLAALPSEQRTIRLRYLHLKATVCKPFAK